jgi:broad specificity phosphatase PhoE
MTADCDSTTRESTMTTTNSDNDDTTTTTSTQTLILVRHARSEGNEFMSKPGNEWDDANLLPLVDLVLVSPLTRAQQTFQYGVLPALQQQRPNNLPPILAQPLSTERVYTASDTGRDTPSLKKEFPWVDWSFVEALGDRPWWYTHEDEEDAEGYQEWRPYGQGQWYAVPGEPADVFEKRMKQLEDWIAAREERTILLVVHWGVIQYLTGGYNAHNCEIKVLDQWKPLHKNAKFL